MNTPHVTMAAPQLMRGGQQCPAERTGIPESGSHVPSRGRGALVWAVVASVLAAATVAFGQGTGTSSYIFGMEDNNNLWRMELFGTTSGSAKQVGTSMLTGSNVNGLAYDSVRDQLFAVSTINNDNYLWWLPSGATNFTSLGNITAFTTGAGVGRPVSAAYYDNAYWFLGGLAPGNQLGKLSLTYSGTGASGVPTGVNGTKFTIAGMPTTASGGGDLAITKSGILYAFSAPGVGNFFTLDVKTAASGTVEGYSLVKTSTGTGVQLAFGIDGTTLYGQDHRDGNWYTVDTSSGNLTQIPGFITFPGGLGFNDLAGSAPGSTVVPEPSACGMVLAGLSCGGFAMWRRRKRC